MMAGARCRQGELVATVQAGPVHVWQLVTDDGLEDVLSSDYFSGQRGLNRLDRIDIIAEASTDLPQFWSVYVSRADHKASPPTVEVRKIENE